MMRRLLTVAAAAALFVSACTSSSGGVIKTSAPGTVDPSASPAASPLPSSTPLASPIVGSSASPVDAGWYLLAPAGNGFTCRFPAQPRMNAATTTEPATKTQKEFSYTTWAWAYTPDTTTIYGVVFAKYPSGSLAGIDPSLLYDAMLKTMTGGGDNQKAGMSMGDQSDIRVDGAAGRAFSGSEGDQKVKGELFIKGSNLYMPMVVYSSTFNDFASLDAFLADFHFGG
jgi:hypothetical protein